jgi:hypothetical protein
LGEHGFGNHNSTGVAEWADGNMHRSGLNRVCDVTDVITK